MEGAACLAGVAGCGAGQEAATSNQGTSAPGSLGVAGDVRVRDAQFTWSDTVPGNQVRPVGASAELQVTIINEGMGAGSSDRLVSVSSPVATTGRIVSDATIPDGQVLVAGYDDPVASVTLDGAREVQIVLDGLLVPIQAGRTCPRRVRFRRRRRAGSGGQRGEPDVLPPRARAGEPDPLVVPGDS